MYKTKFHVLADKKDVDCAQVELVEKWQSSKTIFASVHTSIELERKPISPLVDCRILGLLRRTITVLPLY